MSKSRKEQQAELLIGFGALLAPLEDIVGYPERQTSQTRSRAIAKFTHDRNLFDDAVNTFCRGESGHLYRVEVTQICGRLNRFTNQMPDFRDDVDSLRREIDDVKRVVVDAVLSIPCDLDSDILMAGSPFTAYLKLRSICETAKHKLIFIDPYLGSSVVRRYFSDISPLVRVAVITKMRRGNADFNSFIELSALYANERGPDQYSLNYLDDLHDRYLVCDDEVYHLGGSIKDAGSKSGYTISKLVDGANKIEPILSQAKEQFGLQNKVHPSV